MPGVTRRYPDVLAVLVDALEAVVGVGRTGVETPNNLESVLPFARIMRVGGSRDWLHDRPTVDIDVFASSYADGEWIAEQVAQWLCGPPPPVPELDRVECFTSPRELPWNDDGLVRRFGATYSVTTRRRLVA